MTWQKWDKFRPTRDHSVVPSETDAMVYWQSRAGLREPPRLAPITELAREVRRWEPATP